MFDNTEDSFLPTKTPEQKPAGLENIKALNAMIQPSSPYSGLTNSIVELKRKLDATIKQENEKIRAILRAKKEESRIPIKTEVFAKESTTVPSLKFEGAVVNRAPMTTKMADVKKPLVAEKPVIKTSKSPDGMLQSGGVKVIPRPSTIIPQTGESKVAFTPSYIKGRIAPSQKPPPPPPRGPKSGGKFPFDKSKFPKKPDGGAANATTGIQSPRPPSARPPMATVAPHSSTGIRKTAFVGGDKRKEFRGGDDKRGMNKRTLIRKGFMDSQSFEDERMGGRRLKNKKKQVHVAPGAIKIEKAVITTENLTVKILSEKIGKTAQEIIKKLMQLDIMTSINSVVDFSTMELVANELGVALELKLDKSQEEILIAGHDIVDNEKDLIKRPPIITVMGHVDHGKTSLLDRIRKASVASGEAGGITQHIGAYSVAVKKEMITFLDTPGHEAFTQMRARGAQVTDIAVLVVAADDGIMPQTIEAISHAKAANVPIIVAVNKIDKAGANPDKVVERLTEHGLVTEKWGGDTIVVPLSAKQGTNVDKLLESILLLSEVHGYKANPKRLARASVLEAKIDKGRGPVANVVVLNGTLKVGDTVVAGTTVCKVRAMTDFMGKNIKVAGPGVPVSILGFTEVPNAGDTVLAVEDEKVARQVASERITKFKNEQLSAAQKLTLDDLLTQTSAVKLKDLNIIIKADVKGSAEALKDSLSSLANDEAKAHVVHSGVGKITKTDIMLAEVSKSIIIGFNVKPDSESKIMAESAGISILTYKVIYEAIDQVEKLLKGMRTPKFKENITGRAEVLSVFKITGSGIVAGSSVKSGKIYRNSKVRVLRGGEVVFDGSLRGLKRFKEDVKDVAEGYECGISVDNFSDIKEGDVIEAFHLEQIFD